MKPRLVQTDVLVIGSGGAGLRCAIELHDHGIDCLVVGKCSKRDAHTKLAAGGINAAFGNLDPTDSWELHAADTIRDGGFINDSRAVEFLCKNAPDAVIELKKWGCDFAKTSDNKIMQRFFGAATYRRACFVGDHTGKAILETLVHQAQKQKIKFKSNTYIFSLLKATENKKTVNGAIGLDIQNGKIIVFHAKAVVLATGGHSRVFSRSSSRFWENTGDGIALARQVGARFMDMEMFQFHPTGMAYPSRAEGVLVTEAVRGEGGILTNARGERFMHRYDPKRLELSARDIVARAIFLEVQAGHGTRHDGVWLDISHKPKKYILQRLPQMYRQFKQFGIDISKQKMEVAPTAHYSMGGILVDHLTGKTGVDGLFAIGEVTAGTHGANRLGGNSLAEIIVFGKHTGQVIANEVKKKSVSELDWKSIHKKMDGFNQLLSNHGKNPIQVKHEIQQVLWQTAGVARHAKELKKGLRKLQRFKTMKLKTGFKLKMNEKLIAALDLLCMLPTCEMILLSAQYRTESRGAHYRTDHPKTKTAWKKNVMCTPTPNGFKVNKRPILTVLPRIKRLLKKRFAPPHHLLE